MMLNTLLKILLTRQLSHLLFQITYPLLLSYALSLYMIPNFKKRSKTCCIKNIAHSSLFLQLGHLGRTKYSPILFHLQSSYKRRHLKLIVFCYKPFVTLPKLVSRQTCSKNFSLLLFDFLKPAVEVVADQVSNRENRELFSYANERNKPS
jgi:hypothetical protein